MATLVILLRIIHIFSGIFWVGFALFNMGFLQPTVKATGAEGQTFMRYLIIKTRLLNTVYVAATLTMLAGILLYWLQIGFEPAAMMNGRGLVLLIGGLAGILAWILAMFIIRKIFNGMIATILAIQKQGGPPTPEQLSTMQGLVARLGSVSKFTLFFLIVSVLAMASARYMV